MSRCKVPGCSKELPDNAGTPICEYHKAQIKEKGGGVASVVVAIAVVIPKVVPVIKENKQKIAKAVIKAVKH